MVSSADADSGWRVAQAAADNAAALLGPRLVSAYAIGSLAHGGFSPAVSDVDVALLVDRCDRDVAETAAAVAARTRDQLGSELAGRLSLFYGDWPSFACPPATARMGAIERLDLMDHGVLLLGVDRRASDGLRPSREELLAETARFLAQQAGAAPDAARLVAAGPRALTKAILFPVRFLYTHATGRAGANADAVAWYRAENRPHADLAEAALDWRHREVPDKIAIPLVADHLAGLYDECRRAFTG